MKLILDDVTEGLLQSALDTASRRGRITHKDWCELYTMLGAPLEVRHVERLLPVVSEWLLEDLRELALVSLLSGFVAYNKASDAYVKEVNKDLDAAGL